MSEPKIIRTESKATGAVIEKSKNIITLVSFSSNGKVNNKFTIRFDEFAELLMALAGEFM